MANAPGRSSALRGHYWTVRTGALGRLPGLSAFVYPAPASIPWSTRGRVVRWGEVTLSGKWTRCGSHALLLVLHGLGGDADAPYVRHLAYFAARRGLDCLRLNFRGADRSGAGLYHCVASDDVALALADASLRDYRDVFVAGHSLGGQVALHYASGAPDPRLRAVAAVCPPLDLVALSPYLEVSAYRPLMLANMNRTYRRFFRRAVSSSGRCSSTPIAWAAIGGFTIGTTRSLPATAVSPTRSTTTSRAASAIAGLSCGSPPPRI